MDKVIESKRGISLINYTALTDDEKLLVLKMRNHPDIRRWMHNTEKISVQEHLTFIDSLKKTNTRLYFLVNYDGKDIGTINFTYINQKDKVAEFGLYANPFERVACAGQTLINLGISHAFETLKLNKLELEVFKKNHRAIDLYKKYNFVEKGSVMKNEKELVRMEKNNSVVETV